MMNKLLCTVFLALGLNTASAQSPAFTLQPQIPTSLRQGDALELRFRITNPGAEITGQAQLELFDLATRQPVDGWLLNTFPNQYFTIGAGSSEFVQFPVQIPYTYLDGLRWKLTARVGEKTVSTTGLLPIHHNKQLVVETTSLEMQNKGRHATTIKGLAQALPDSSGKQAFALDLYYGRDERSFGTKALEYLLLPAHQTTSAKVRQVFANMAKEKFGSNGSKNNGLSAAERTALVAATPWMLERHTGSQGDRNLSITEENIIKSQHPNGGFSFAGEQAEDAYTTQEVLITLGRLRKLGVERAPLNEVATKALAWLDQYMVQQAKTLKAIPTPLQMQALYARSYFTDRAMTREVSTAFEKIRAQAAQSRTTMHPGLAIMTEVVMLRGGIQPASVYYKPANTNTGTWWTDPALRIALQEEAALEAGRNTVNETNLLLSLQHGQHWRSPAVTEAAAYVLLRSGESKAAPKAPLGIQLGKTKLLVQSDTAWYHHRLEGTRLSPDMARIETFVTEKNNSYSTAQWLYTTTATKAFSKEAKLSTIIYQVKQKGATYQRVRLSGTANLKVGDSIIVQNELTATTPLQHLVLRIEPSSAVTLSTSELLTPKGTVAFPAAGIVFMQQLPAGKIVIESKGRVAYAGSFSEGRSLLQSTTDPSFQLSSLHLPLRAEE